MLQDPVELVVIVHLCPTVSTSAEGARAGAPACSRFRQCQRSTPPRYGEAAHSLGCTSAEVRRLLATGRLQRTGDRRGAVSPAEAEALAAEVYRWTGAARERDPSSYWVTGQVAADVLGVNRARLGNSPTRDGSPFVRHRDGTRLYRRDQLEVIANARAAKPESRTW